MAQKEFLDKTHDKVIDRYFEISCEDLEIAKSKKDFKEIVVELEKLIKIDPKFLDSYTMAATILRNELDDNDKSLELEKLAYEIAIDTITDKNGECPEQLPWGWLENRHIVRAIDTWAYNLWWQGKTEEALEIFRKLLKSNLSDNIGARHSILAIRLGLKPDYDEKWTAEFGIDARKLWSWWDGNYKKFPDEFSEWEKEWGDDRVE